MSAPLPLVASVCQRAGRFAPRCVTASRAMRKASARFKFKGGTTTVKVVASIHAITPKTAAPPTTRGSQDAAAAGAATVGLAAGASGLAGTCQSPFQKPAGSNPHRPVCQRRHSTIQTGTSPSSTTMVWSTHTPGATAANSGSDISTRSKTKCSSIEGSRPNRR